MIIEFSSNYKATFYPCTVFRQPRQFPEGTLICRYLADDTIVYYITVLVKGGNSIVYEFYALAASGLCTKKSTAEGSYRIYNIFVSSENADLSRSRLGF